MLGKTLAVTLNASGSVLWAANDRGYIESFRIDCTIGKIQVLCDIKYREIVYMLLLTLSK